jgi:hypothetical protein
MDMSKSIVAAIYSKEPPGRFLKHCPETGQWNELSKREAADKAAQAMAYAVKGEYLKQKRRERRLRSCPLPSFNEGTASAQTQTSDVSNRQEGYVASSVARRGLTAREKVGTSNAEFAYPANDDHQASNEMVHAPVNYLPERLGPQLQQSSSSTYPTTSGAPLSANQYELVQVLAQAVQQQRRHYQQQQQQQQQQQLLLLQQTLWHHGQFQSTQLLPPSFGGLALLLAQAQQQQQQQLLLLQQTLWHHGQFQSTQLLPPSFGGLALLLAQAQQQQMIPPLQSTFGQNLLALPTPPSALPNHHSPSNLLLTGSQPVSSITLHDTLPSDEFLPGMLGNFQSQPNPIGTSNSRQQAQQMDQTQLILQQQLLMSSLTLSNQDLLLQQPLPSGPMHQAQQTALLHQNHSNSPQHTPPNNNVQPSAYAAASSNMQDGSEDEEQSGSDGDQVRVQPYEQV